MCIRDRTTTNQGSEQINQNLTVQGTSVSLGNGSAATISTPSGNANLSLTPNGTGALNLGTANTGNIAIGNTTGTVGINGSTTVAGTATFSVAGGLTSLGANLD